MSKPDPVAIFSALGDPLRLELLSRLSQRGGITLGELVAGTGISRQGATKHLRVLEDAGLAASEFRGRERRVVFTPRGLEAAQTCLDQIAQGWQDTLGRLKAHVESRESE